MPASRPAMRCASSARAVSAMTGVSDFARSSRRRSVPSASGRPRSSTTSAGFISSKSARARAPVGACSTMNPAFRRYSVTSSATDVSSSTTTMRAVPLNSTASIRRGIVASMEGTLAVILAHPDDETFGTGGTLIRYASEGIKVHSLCLTEGEKGWAGGEGAPILPREHVGAARALELAEAGRRMGLASVTCLRYPDGGLADVNEDYVVRDIVRWLRTVRPQVVIAWGPDGGV